MYELDAAFAATTLDERVLVIAFWVPAEAALSKLLLFCLIYIHLLDDLHLIYSEGRMGHL